MALPTPYAAFLPSFAFNSGVTSFVSHLPTEYSLEALKLWYLTANPVHPALLFCTVMSFLVWVVGELTGNVSQVDRLWTFLPMAYSVHFTFWPKWSGTGEVDERMFLVFILQILWSARLTTNTYRRGFFNPYEEDYRWEYVRQRIPVWQFKIMNFAFIAIIQNMLLAAAELPQYLLLTLTPAFSPSFRNPGLNILDYGLAAIFVSILVLEMVSDNQQQTYQHFKAQAKTGKAGVLSPNDEGRLARGFVTDGLWSFSRHPNFACEQSTWWVMYAFTVIPFIPTSSLTFGNLTAAILSIDSVGGAVQFGKNVQGLLWNYSIWSPITMSMLFYSSTDLTEKISSAKYPLYANYKQAVGEFWPPITILKSAWLTVTGQKSKVHNIVFGSASKAEKKKQ